MIGEEFGSWTWTDDGVVELSPVVHDGTYSNAAGQFYAIRYFTAGKTFKFNSARAWDNHDFNSLKNNDGFTIDGNNCKVEESGVYLVHIDLKAEKLHMEKARVYGLGDVFGGEWTEEMASTLFDEDGSTLKIKAQGGGIPRMYVASAISTSPWWSREFVIKDGKIVYRESGEIHADADVVLAEQTIVLDFNAGTGSFEGEGVVAFAAELTVPGNWTGSAWNETAPKLAGDTNGLFRGALVMTAESGVEFKFMHKGSWIGGTTVSEYNYTLGSSDNMSIAAGTYLWTVDLVNNTAVALPVTKVGLMGSFNNWADDVVLTFNETNLTYTGNVTLAANDELKVRFNGNWEIPSLGGSLEKLSAFGGNIAVADAGTYAVVLDLNASTLTLTPAN